MSLWGAFPPTNNGLGNKLGLSSVEKRLSLPITTSIKTEAAILPIQTILLEDFLLFSNTPLTCNSLAIMGFTTNQNNARYFEGFIHWTKMRLVTIRGAHPFTHNEARDYEGCTSIHPQWIWRLWWVHIASPTMRLVTMWVHIHSPTMWLETTRGAHPLTHNEVGNYRGCTSTHPQWGWKL